MILEPKLSLLTLMVTLGPLYLRQRSLPVAKRGRCVNYARSDFNKAIKDHPVLLADGRMWKQHRRSCLRHFFDVA